MTDPRSKRVILDALSSPPNYFLEMALPIFLADSSAGSELCGPLQDSNLNLTVK
jgi:hypothetical protein